MKHQSTEISRRAAIVVSTRLVLQAAVVAMSVPPQAHAKAAKVDFFYQEKPKEGKTCSTCRVFVPAEGGKGSCAIVEGDIAATGWCMAYSPRT